jgi:hypothetical protein
MSIIEVTKLDLPLIIFNSEEWDENHDESDVAQEIINYIKENNTCKRILIQNISYEFGDTGVNLIISINTDDYGGLKGTLSTFIEDVIFDLIPEYDDEE